MLLDRNTKHPAGAFTVNVATFVEDLSPPRFTGKAGEHSGFNRREITDDKKLEILEDAQAFKNISNMPARVKCALLAWHTLDDMLSKGEK